MTKENKYNSSIGDIRTYSDAVLNTSSIRDTRTYLDALLNISSNQTTELANSSHSNYLLPQFTNQRPQGSEINKPIALKPNPLIQKSR